MPGYTFWVLLNVAHAPSHTPSPPPSHAPSHPPSHPAHLPCPAHPPTPWACPVLFIGLGLSHALLFWVWFSLGWYLQPPLPPPPPAPKVFSANLRAISAVRGSAMFRRALRLVVDAGNFMNHGSRLGGAVGFRLRSLPKLQDTK